MSVTSVVLLVLQNDKPLLVRRNEMWQLPAGALITQKNGEKESELECLHRILAEYIPDAIFAKTPTDGWQTLEEAVAVPNFSPVRVRIYWEQIEWEDVPVGAEELPEVLWWHTSLGYDEVTSLTRLVIERAKKERILILK